MDFTGGFWIDTRPRHRYSRGSIFASAWSLDWLIGCRCVECFGFFPHVSILAKSDCYKLDYALFSNMIRYLFHPTPHDYSAACVRGFAVRMQNREQFCLFSACFRFSEVVRGFRRFISDVFFILKDFNKAKYIYKLINIYYAVFCWFHKWATLENSLTWNIFHLTDLQWIDWLVD